MDRTGSGPVVPEMSEEERVRVGQRAARFAKGFEGNKKFKAKLSIEELLKTVVGVVILA